MSIVTKQAPLSTVSCDATGCRVAVSVFGHSDLARTTLKKLHGWACDNKQRIDLCPRHKPPELYSILDTIA